MNIVAKRRTKNEAYNIYLAEHPYSALEKFERSFSRHSFAFVWIPILGPIDVLYSGGLLILMCPLAIINVFLFVFYGLLIPLVVLMSWDWEVKRNYDWYCKNVVGSWIDKNSRYTFYIPVLKIIEFAQRSFIFRYFEVDSMFGHLCSEEADARKYVNWELGYSPEIKVIACFKCSAYCELCYQITKRELINIIAECINEKKPFTCPKCKNKTNFHTMFEMNDG